MRKFCRRILSLTLLCSSLALSPIARAHTFALTLGQAAGATNYFGLICSNDGGVDTDHLYVDVLTNTPNAPLVSVLVKRGQIAMTTTDTISGDTTASPGISIPGGNGVYDLFIHKSGAGAVTYTITLHCLDASGTVHTGTDGVVYQYQG